MKKILALALLAASLTVVPGSTASAAGGCGVGWFPPAYGNPGHGDAACDTLNRGEDVRVEFKCATANNVYDPQGWFVGPWSDVGGVHSTKTCNTSYPYVALIQYNLMLNGCDACE